MAQVNLYDFEKDAILKLVQSISEKWWGKPNTPANLAELHNELVGRLADLGYKTTVDVTPTIAGKPIDVRIDDRIQQIEFDYDKHRDEIRKSRELGGV